MFPGILVVLAPIHALTNALGMSVDVYPGRGLAYPRHSCFWSYDIVLSAFALFACDALAERIGVVWSRRAVLALAEGVVLFNISVFWGHPDDAIAVGLAIYSLIAAFDGRFPRAGWLFGAAVAFQPLVIVALPILLALGGKRTRSRSSFVALCRQRSSWLHRSCQMLTPPSTLWSINPHSRELPTTTRLLGRFSLRSSVGPGYRRLSAAVPFERSPCCSRAGSVGGLCVGVTAPRWSCGHSPSLWRSAATPNR